MAPEPPGEPTPAPGGAGAPGEVGAASFPPDAETRELIRRARAGDTAAREALVAGHLRLVRYLVWRFPRAAVEEADLFQAGCVGLLLAVDRFDPAMPVRFSTYAVPTILGEIRAYLARAGSPGASRRMIRLASACRRVGAELQARTGRAPTLQDLAAALGEPEDELLLALEATQTPLSLDAPAGGPGEEGVSPLATHLGEGEEEAAAVVEGMALRQVLAGLTPRERRLLLLRFVEERTQREVGEVLGLSQVQVSRLERRLLARIRSELTGGVTGGPAGGR